MTEYFVQIKHKDGFVSTDSQWKNLIDARKRFNAVCETHKDLHFKLIRRKIIEELVCESEDCRQTAFEF